MKRKFLMICMLFTMSVSMIACADGSDSSKEEEIREENEKEEDESREEGFIMQKLAAWTGHEVTMTDSNLEDATEEGLTGESVTSDESLDTDAMVELEFTNFGGQQMKFEKVLKYQMMLL